MSVSELPPIGVHPGSGKSRRSSRDSSSGGKGSRGILKYERQSLFSADSNELVDIEQMPNGRAAIKRSFASPGSNGSSSPSHPGSGPNVQLRPLGMSRAKSWCATEANAGSTPKLETLFERNGIKTHKEKVEFENPGNTETVPDHTVTAVERTVSVKPPRARFRSQGSESSNTGTIHKRSLSNSVTNLVKLSDTRPDKLPTKSAQGNPHSHQPRSRSSLQNSQRFRSEQSLFNSSGTSQAGLVSARTDSRLFRLPARRTDSHRHSNVVKQTLRSSKSNPSLPDHGHLEPSQPSLTPQNLKNMENQVSISTQRTIHADPENVPNADRIVEWLIGVDNAESPETPAIEEETPRQTDTAIHIVYDKD